MEFLSLSFFFARKYGVSFGSKERKREGSGRSHHQRNQAASFQENSETEEERFEGGVSMNHTYLGGWLKMMLRGVQNQP